MQGLLSVSTKWQRHFVEFAFFTVSEADGREKWKEWFRLWPKPPRPTGIAGRYESSQRGIIPLRHLLIWFVDSLRRPFAGSPFLYKAPCLAHGAAEAARRKFLRCVLTCGIGKTTAKNSVQICYSLTSPQRLRESQASGSFWARDHISLVTAASVVISRPEITSAFSI